MTIYQPKVSKSCFGVHGDEEIPVIIPNTEVKLISGDYTAMRETSTMPNYREALRKGSFSFVYCGYNRTGRRYITPKKIAHLAEDWAIFALRVCCSIYLFFVFKKQGIFII